MISYYPTHLFPFLSIKPTLINPNIFRHYYLSWEDALWEILPQLGIKQNSTILLPDFYCLDVIKNIKLHGYKVKLYPLDNDFQTSMTQFEKIYLKVKPSVVIFFHACGITNTLTKNSRFMRRIAGKSLIIDDYVHRVIDTTKIKLIHDHHLILDSLRKNIPLPGAFVYSSSNTHSKLSRPHTNSLSYTLRVLIHFIIYRSTLTLGDLMGNKYLIKYAHHHLLKTHDDLVGDSIAGNSGLPWIPHIHKHINLSKIRAQKMKQAQYYQNHLSSLLQSSNQIWIPKINAEDIAELHAFPVIIDLPHAKRFEDALSSINVWTKFTDSLWSKNKRAFFLPLGFHLTRNDQNLIIKTILRTAQTT